MTHSDSRCFLHTYVRFSFSRDSKEYEPVLRTLHTRELYPILQHSFFNSALRKELLHRWPSFFRSSPTLTLGVLVPGWLLRSAKSRRASAPGTSGLTCLRRTNTPICLTEFPRSQLGVHNFDPVQSRQGIYDSYQQTEQGSE